MFDGIIFVNKNLAVLRRYYEEVTQKVKWRCLSSSWVFLTVLVRKMGR
jgi:hypothetical protein